MNLEDKLPILLQIEHSAFIDYRLTPTKYYHGGWRMERNSDARRKQGHKITQENLVPRRFCLREDFGLNK